MRKTLISMTAFIMVGCVHKEDDVPAKPPTDVEIIQARNYIADYDQRMSVAKKTIVECISAGKVLKEDQQYDIISSCERIGYDTSGFYIHDNRLSGNDKNEYREKKSIALYPISSELN